MRHEKWIHRPTMSSRSRALAALWGVVLVGVMAGCGVGAPDESSNTKTQSTATDDSSKSEKAEELTMPSVVDKNAAVAKDELEKLGFTKIELGSVDPENNTLGVVNPSNWTVKEQSHQKGEKVAADAVIVLGCVKN